MSELKKIFESVKFPILINSFNRPTYLKLLIDQLNTLNIIPIVIDNCSNNKQLLKYYKKNNNENFLLIRFDKNYGHNVIFSNELYENLPNYFAYTDCDIQLNKNLPKNFIEILCELTNYYVSFKAGFALAIDNVKLKNSINRKTGYTIKNWEKNFWTKPLKHKKYEIYSAAIDTTFAIYNKKNDNFCGGKTKNNSIRVAGNFTAIHLPWIEDDPMSKTEYEFYINNDTLNIGDSYK